METNWNSIYAESKIIAPEMESFALFTTAQALKKEAACLLTVSIVPYSKEQNLSAEACQNAFNDVVFLMLETAITGLD